MIGYTPRGMQLAEDKLVYLVVWCLMIGCIHSTIACSFSICVIFSSFPFSQKEMMNGNFFLSPKMGSDLLFIASGEQVIYSTPGMALFFG